MLRRDPGGPSRAVVSGNPDPAKIRTVAELLAAYTRGTSSFRRPLVRSLLNSTKLLNPLKREHGNGSVPVGTLGSVTECVAE